MARSHLLAALALAAGCGSSGHARMADAAMTADAYPTAPHTPYPQIPDQGGPRLAHPQLVTVTFANDPRAPTLEAFAQWIVGSSWLHAVGAEYGVDAGAVAGVAHRPETPPAMVTSADIEAYLAAGVADGSIPKPASLAGALYIIYYPASTTITATFVHGITKVSCSDFGGYHGEVHGNGMDFAYAAIPSCAGVVPGLSADETTEMIVSHEVIEAATDAMPITAPAWQLHEDPSDAWFAAFGGFEVEVGDMCEEPSRFVKESGFVAQRSWSNAAAAAGGEPCLPVDPALPAFGVTLQPAGTQHAAAGSTIDLAVTGWSTAAVADWKLSADVWGNTTLGNRTKVTFDAATLNNRGTTMMHVTLPGGAASGTVKSIFVISSHSTADTDATTWPLAVAVP